MKLIPFLIAVFLFVNPLLERVFRKLDLQTEKLQFWVMLTSGTAWVLALVNFLLNPKGSIVLVTTAGTELLPNLAFSQDWISAALILAAAGMIFVIVLTQQNSPQANAWLAGMGGACVIGLGSHSAYTLGLTWTILEFFHFYYSFQDRKIASNPRKYLPVGLLRVSAPAALILLSLTQEELGKSAFIAELNPRTGPVLIVAGLVGFLGWFLSLQGREADQPRYFLGAAENWIPGLLGMLLIVRGGEIVGAGTVQDALPLILSILLFLSALAGLLLDLSPGLWFLGCGLMASVAAILSGPESALSWGVVMALPGLQLWKGSNQPSASLIPLILAALGLLPIPFLPSWAGVIAFSEGLPGIFMGLSYGILVGSVLITVLKNWQSTRPDPVSHSLLRIIGAVAVLVSQVVISLRLGLINASQGLLNQPIAIWISLLGLLPVLILGNYLPLRKGKGWGAAASRLSEGSGKALTAILHFLDRLVDLISRVFEGQGGLIWALLIGLLIITLISMGGDKGV